jgi:hypothetical protein
VSPDDVYQVRIERRSRFLGDGFLVDGGLVDGGLVGGFQVDPAFVVTTAAVVRDAGPSVELRAPRSGAGDSGADAPVAAEVVEVLGEDGLALLEVAAPGFLVLPRPAEPSTELTGAGLPARAVGDELLRFRRLGAAHLRAELEGLAPHRLNGAAEKLGGGKGGGGESSTLRIAQGQAGGGQRAESDGLTAGRQAAAGGAGDCVRGALLLDYLRERARSGRLDPMVTVPAPGVREGSR